VEKVTRVSRDQQHHFYAKLLETSRKFWGVQRFLYFYSRGDTANLQNC